MSPVMVAVLPSPKLASAVLLSPVIVAVLLSPTTAEAVLLSPITVAVLRSPPPCVGQAPPSPCCFRR